MLTFTRAFILTGLLLFQPLDSPAFAQEKSSKKTAKQADKNKETPCGSESSDKKHANLNTAATKDSKLSDDCGGTRALRKMKDKNQ